MASGWKANLIAAVEKYPRNHSKFITYGTAGFRTKAEDLTHVLFRMGLVGALRSVTQGSKGIGLMITASHNAEPDNGVKLVDPKGEMLEISWETIATNIANCEDQDLANQIESLCSQWNIDVSKDATVVIGRDTRPSSDSLRDAATAGAGVLGARVIDHGVITTPMLHYFVVLHNTGILSSQPEQNYYEKLSKPFNSLREKSRDNGNYSAVLSFDGANGVGAIAMNSLMKYLSDSLTVYTFNSNTGAKGKLNYMCGADYVKTRVRLPDGIEVVKGRRCASVDGDADRLVFYFVDSMSNFHLLDGDRIATLLAGYIAELVKECGLQLKLGLVQTAYANGSSTKYISEQLKMEAACVSTGVKHLHSKAHEFDVGIYFEANGHGTVVFSQTAREAILKAASKDNGDRSSGGSRLAALMEMTNEAVGDALSDLLLVETVLGLRGWSASDWLNTYTDLPSRLTTVKVKDRNVVVTKNAEGECSKPEGLQDAINKLVAEHPSARAFVRASGTEDVVRVYAEAETKDAVDKLACDVTIAVYNLAGGVGEPPHPYYGNVSPLLK